MLKVISLFPPKDSTNLVSFVGEKIDYHIDTNKYTHLFIAPSIEEVEILVRGGTKLSLMSRKSPYSDIRSHLREFSVSGYSSQEEGHNILQALSSKPFKDKAVGNKLHIHLANHQPLQEGDNTTREEQQPNLFEIIEPKIKFNDLILPDPIKNRIQTNINLIKYRYVFLHEFGFENISGFKNKFPLSLNLVGDSGVGKTAIAEATAHILGKLLMIVDYAQLESEYPGRTSKYIKIVFEEASKNDAVLLFDEADVCLGTRVEVHQGYDHSVNNARSVMLLELAKFEGVVLFTTNLASNYDPAFRRRILDHIEIPKPNEEARTLILEKHTPANLPGRQQLDFQLLASKSDGFSGSDLANVIKKASIKLLEKVAQGSSEITISNEDCLEAIEEVNQGKQLIENQTKLKEVTPGEIIDQLPKPEKEADETND